MADEFIPQTQESRTPGLSDTTSRAVADSLRRHNNSAEEHFEEARKIFSRFDKPDSNYPHPNTTISDDSKTAVSSPKTDSTSAKLSDAPAIGDKGAKTRMFGAPTEVKEDGKTYYRFEPTAENIEMQGFYVLADPEKKGSFIVKSAEKIAGAKPANKMDGHPVYPKEEELPITQAVITPVSPKSGHFAFELDHIGIVKQEPGKATDSYLRFGSATENGRIGFSGKYVEHSPDKFDLTDIEGLSGKTTVRGTLKELADKKIAKATFTRTDKIETDPQTGEKTRVCSVTPHTWEDRKGLFQKVKPYIYERDQEHSYESGFNGIQKACLYLGPLYELKQDIESGRIPEIKLASTQ